MIARIPLRAALIAAGAAVALGLGPAGAADMNKDVEALKKRVADLESGTSVTVSGYVKGDFYIDSHEDLGQSFGNATTVRHRKIGDSGEGADGNDDGAVGAHANQSRLRVSTSTDTSYGALNTVLEGDMWNGVLRLFQAYGELGPVLAGQAWSIRGDDHTTASTVDFDGPAGVVATRTVQLRLTLPLGEGFTGQMAIEKPISGNEVPTFLAALRYSSGWGAVNVTGAAGRYDDAAGDNVTTHSLHFGAHFNATDATRVMATLNLTSGDGQIYGGAGATNVDDDPATNLKAYDSIGGFAGVSHGWTDTISSGVYYGWARNDNPAAALNKMVQTVHANVFWSPVPQSSIGFEFIYGSRETNGGAEGEATRFQIGVQYSF